MDWFVNVNGETYGPYILEQMQEMVKEKRVIGDNLVYTEEMGQWSKASNVEVLGLGAKQGTPSAKQDQGYAKSGKGVDPSKPIKRKKKGNGCLTTLLVFVLIIAVAIGSVVLAAEGIIFKDKKMDLARAEKWLDDSVDATGGSISVNNSSSPINGFTLEVPSEAYADTTDFKISTQEIKSHEYGDAVTPITPVIKVENGGDYSDVPMDVSIPIEISDDEFAMAFYYNDDGSLEALPTVSLTKDEIVVSTRHFSNFFVSKILTALLSNVEIDTGFRPGVDDWSFPNYGSQIASGGFCAGASISAAYYYYEYKKTGAVPLSQFLDNNHYVNTPTTWYDDSIGIRLASEVQRSNYQGEYWDTNDYWKFLYDKFHTEEQLSDEYMYLGFAYAMMVTGDPQVMTLWVRDESGDKVKLDAGHAIVAYRVGPEGIYVSDPNYIGVTDLYVPYNGTEFGSYNTSTSVETSTLDYNSFALVAKSALVNWDALEALFDEALEDPEDSTIGDKYFSDTELTVGVLDNDNLKFETLDDAYELEEVDKRELKVAIEKYLVDIGAPSSSLPQDWEDKDYILLKTTNDALLGNVKIYQGDSQQPIKNYDTRNGRFSGAFLPLDLGLNNFGVYYQERVVSRTDTELNYIDYKRAFIKNKDEDLTGEWEGKLYITNDEVARKYLKKVLEPIIRSLLEWWGGIVNKTYTEAEIQDILDENLDLKKQFEDGIPFLISISDKNGGEYKLKVMMQFDEEPVVYETTGKLKRGTLKFDFTAYKGLKFAFEYDLYDNKTLDGDFQVSWMVLRKFVEGECKLTKQ